MTMFPQMQQKNCYAPCSEEKIKHGQCDCHNNIMNGNSNFKFEIPLIEKINFSKNWNNKLICFMFTSIRPVSDKYNIGERYDVRINEVHYGYADLVDLKILSLNELIKNNYHLLDTGLIEKEFYEFFEKMYGKKKWWKEKETTIQLLFFKKLVQLDIFDNKTGFI